MIKKKMKVKSNASKSKKRKIIDTIVIFVLACVVIVSFGGFLVLNQILKDSDGLQSELLEGKQPTRMLDENGQVAIELSSGDGIRENITYDQVPQVVVDAFLAVEDSRYFKHNGFDLPRFIKSAYENLKSGGFAQGGSTLTMQMIDVSHETTSSSQSTLQKLAGKIQEIFLALDAESYLSKEEILMKYLNLINFGGPARGIQKGAQYYFGKDISEVTLSEAAFLAGVINAPNAYNPYLNYENAVARRNNALSLMKLHGYISEEEYQLALNTKLSFQLNGTTTFDGLPLQSYVDYVDKYCRENLGINIYDGDMIIYTTMNLEMQQLYDAIMNGEYGFFDGQSDLLQCGSALIDLEDGSIAAIAGGRSYIGDNRKNYGYNERRQTGSSIKPLMDYALAFDYLGWSTDQIISDVPTDFGNFKPKNAGGKFNGDVTISDAIARSLNIPALKALFNVVNTVGTAKVIDIMRSLNFDCFYDLSTNEFELGMGIGGSNMVASPLQMAAAYGALANGGVYTEPYAITKIEFLNSDKEDYVHVPVTRQVYSPQAAYLTTNMLVKAVSDYPTSFQGAMRSSYQVAAKTGTSDWAEDGLQWGIPVRSAKDKWTVAYTSKYSIATWMGFDTGADGWMSDALMNKNIPTKINKLVFDQVHKENKPADFVQPSGVVSITHLKGAFDNGHFEVPAGTPANMISTGLIKSEFATLKQLTPDELSEILSFTASVNASTKKIEMKFAAYPNAEALLAFDGLYHGVEADPTFSGPKVFSKTAVFGPVVYKVEVYQDGVIIGSNSYSSDSVSDSFNITPGKEVTVCGFYGYANNPDSRTREICATLSSEDTAKLGNDEKPEKPEKPDDHDRD